MSGLQLDLQWLPEAEATVSGMPAQGAALDLQQGQGQGQGQQQQRQQQEAAAKGMAGQEPEAGVLSELTNNLVELKLSEHADRLDDVEETVDENHARCTAQHARLAAQVEELERRHNSLQGQVGRLQMAQQVGQAQQGEARQVRPRQQEAAVAAQSPAAAQPGPAAVSGQANLAEPQQAQQGQQEQQAGLAARLPRKQEAMDGILKHSLLQPTIGQAAVEVANQLCDALGVQRDARGLMPVRFKGLTNQALHQLLIDGKARKVDPPAAQGGRPLWYAA
ncbi:hypothetical protein ABPG77_001680 [Micractinium sp. CCAP 211/92]